ncbi:hypothetical protein Pmani_035646 [Petrolisthes manimaculis]|uniref:Ankyrin repeat, SAM and basic leucine zipper domain-containing protein 1 n=1 Tax=Petrolisthes manimaculis TaxID=1843537 RepID=A0AAE1NLC0_9EUCA|nr:hypothetical protein Pmani_035646 [Petrolisthes manimaculis]
MFRPAGQSDSSEDELELESAVGGPDYIHKKIYRRRPLEETIDMTPTLYKGNTENHELPDIACVSKENNSQNIGNGTTLTENGLMNGNSISKSEEFVNGQSNSLYPEWHNGCLKASSPAPSYTSGKSRSPTPFRNGSWRGTKMHQGYSLPCDEFRMATMQGNLPVIKSLLKQGMAVDQILKSGWTALMYACSSGRPLVVRTLLEHEADPNIHKELFTPLMAACASSRECEEDLLECVKSLLVHGAKVDAAERHRMTPLMFASKEGRTAIVQELLVAKASVNKQDNKGWTALCWAATRGHGKVIRLLLQHSADPDKMNTHGQRPSDVALAAGYPEVADILDRFSAGGCLTSIVSMPDDKISASKFSSRASSENRKVPQVFGELEMVLSGLDLSYMIPLFQEHEVSFESFLRLSEKDLEAMGVTAVGVRKKLLRTIKDIHKKEWQTSSLPNPAAKDFQMTVPEAAAMIANINKHFRYIHATVGYLRDQIEADPRLLQLGQEVHSVTTLATNCGDSLKHLQGLHEEIKFFKCHLDKVSGNAEYASADLIVDRADNGRAWQRRFLASLVSATAIATILWYSRPKIFSHIFNITRSNSVVMLDI